jgi:hypothetical protein
MNQPTTDPGNERALIARARAGDENAFAQLVTEHSARVYGSLRRFGLSPREADEVADLRDRGVLTDEEFERAKAKVLG